MPQLNHKNQPFRDYVFTLSGSSHTRSLMTRKLEGVFRRRKVSDSSSQDGFRTIVMRDETVVRFKPRSANGMHSLFMEPFLEMRVRTTHEYMDRSADAMRLYARKVNVPLLLDVSEAEPQERKKHASKSPSERPGG